jgi:hypothetical protein
MLTLARQVATELIAVLVLGSATFLTVITDSHSAGTGLRQSGAIAAASRVSPELPQDQVRDFSHD